jgi:hypothetical protein
MWDQCPLEILKLMASILTPLVIAAAGFFINKSIQRQNDIAQSQLSWRTKWADDFFKTATDFNDSATRFILLYYSSELKVKNDFPGAVDEQKSLHNEILPLAIALNRGCLEIAKFASFAPINGKSLEDAADSLYSEANSWMQNKGGKVQAFRQRQLTFNTTVRNVHAELLGLKDLK